MASPVELARLIDLHLGELRPAQPSWLLSHSEVAGRGIFASRDIEPGEVLFRERALVTGPTARKGSILNTCVCCHKMLPVKDFLCKRKCSLPVCEDCSDSAQHHDECGLFNKWQPMDLGIEDAVNPLSLRILTAVRVFFLGPDQRALMNAMQANPERGYRQEIIKAAQCFRKFPTTDKPFMDNLFRTVGVLNTNAFEAPFRTGDLEILLRGVFPLTAVMNHECTPNASHFFDNNLMVTVRSSRFIPKGAEITTTYTKILWSNITRGVFLKMTKHFVCDCVRCNDNTVSLSGVMVQGHGRGLVCTLGQGCMLRVPHVTVCACSCTYIRKEVLFSIVAVQIELCAVLDFL